MRKVVLYSTRMDCDTHADLERLFRRDWGRMLASLVRILGPGRLALAEDVLQEAMVSALQTWSIKGKPVNPTAWLVQVARNRAIDSFRREALLVSKQDQILSGLCNVIVADRDLLGDDQLDLLFRCCHPALTKQLRVPLMLRAIIGLRVPEIARALLCKEPTIYQRLNRARVAVAQLDADLDLMMLESRALGDRVDSVLEILYLVFNEGYAATEGDRVIREELSFEAIRLARLLLTHPLTNVSQTHALLSLFLFQAARFPARLDGSGEIIRLEEQDRSLWDGELIDEGLEHLKTASADSTVSSYHLEAGIAATHSLAPSADATDWAWIVKLYDELLAREPSPIVALNRAVAISRQRGALAGWTALHGLFNERSLRESHLLYTVAADFCERLHETERAADYYRRALTCRASAPERRLLARRLSAIERRQ